MTNTMDAVMWLFGFNKKEAQQYIKEATSEMLNEINKTYTDNAKKSFYND